MTQTAPAYKAMAMLTTTHPPKVKGREPYWRPKAAPISDAVRLPVWSWDRSELPGAVHPTDIITMDVNAAFLAACSSAPFAHGQLENTWPRDLSAPGLYLIDAHPWTNFEIVSPLGQQPLEDDRVWVAQPTVKLLDQLSRDGWWPAVEVHDGWTSTSCRLRRWTDAVQADRAAAITARAAVDPRDAEAYAAAQAHYDAIKDGYSIAVQLMRGPAEGAAVKSSVRRPDWYQTVHAQHAASTWRKAWGSVLAGHGPVSMGTVDEVTWTVEDLAELQMRAKPVFRVDDTGLTIGAFKVKPKE